jgi:hypothetical protein
MLKHLNLVVDYHTNAILTFPVSTATAVHVSSGILDTYTTNIPTDLKAVKNIVNQFDLVNDLLQLSYDKVDGQIQYLRPLPEHLQTDELKQKRALAKLRAKYIYYQESYYRIYMNRSVFAPNYTIIPYLLQELNDCDSINDSYSDGIKEYSEILGITEKEAYDELMILTESASIIKMRYFAWYMKNISEINKLFTEEDMQNYSKTVWENIINEQVL